MMKINRFITVFSAKKKNEQNKEQEKRTKKKNKPN